ncbi:MAG: hypothetical protein U9O90_01335 [Euryarchaeota archaeon]|nr:hypothetical protein [Euryarchaeota archaeon]
MKISGTGIAMAIIIIAVLLSHVSAVEHYEVSVTTGNTTWTIDRTNLPVSFDMSGTVSGNGTMILKHGIDLAGVCKKDLISTQPGEVTISEILDLKSTTDHVNITATVQEDNATMNITEAWPTSLIDEIELSYNGKGISSWETYSNNNDIICSRFRATKLEKASRCNTTLIKTVASAEITPEKVTEIQGFVTGTDYILKATSDKFSHFDYKHEENDKISIRGSESYFGNYSIITAIKMAAFVEEPKDKEPEEWLPCPWGDQ